MAQTLIKCQNIIKFTYLNIIFNGFEILWKFPYFFADLFRKIPGAVEHNFPVQFTLITRGE